MKRNKIFIGAACLLLAGAMTSCESDYLQLSPVTDLGTSVIGDDVAGAKVALNGLCRAMYDGYSVGNNQNVGETYVNSLFNDSFGPDYFGSLMSNYMTATNYKWAAMNNTNTWYTQVLWMYPYNLINQANQIITSVTDATSGTEAEKNFVVAQAYTIRAHAYIKLLQFYAPRWEDSKNGETYVCVIRKEPSTENVALSTMNQVLKLIYDDLDTAIALYDNAPGQMRSFKWAPDKSVAQGLYARAALIKHDWGTAQTMANAARENYTLRSAAECFNGFVDPTDDDMWCSSNDYNSTVGYWSWGTHLACNGRYTQTWQLGTGAINMDLYRELDPNDVRRDWFLTPDKIYDIYGYMPALAQYNLQESDFWNKNYVSGSTMQLTGNLLLASAYFGLYQFDEVNNYPDKSDWYYPYLAVTESGQLGLCRNYFGSQYKFWGKGGYAAGSYPYMRACEMVLAEAEAAYMAGDETTAKACLTELNSKRIAGYSCQTSGQALLDEIRLSRRIELWGEGQNWSDFKRWNLPMVRRAWVEGDVTSGSCPSTMAVTIQPNEYDGWRWGLSRTESDYNPEVKPEMFLQ